MSDGTARQVIDRVFADLVSGDAVCFLFQGGEPTLAGIGFYRQFTATVEEKCADMPGISVHYAIQTNGILLDDAWCAFLREKRFLVGLSLDGDAELHDRNRFDAHGNGSFSRVMRAKQLLCKHGVSYNVLCVLTNEAARHPDRIWRFLCREEIGHVQFIPCLDDAGMSHSDAAALTPVRFSSFYTVLLRRWAEALEAGRYISVKFFDDIFNLLLRRQVTACGFTGQCQRQIVVESDGSVYPCDFYAYDEWKLGDLTTQTVMQILESDNAHAFLSRERVPPDICRTCKWRTLCGGGCPRMEKHMYVQENGQLCGYREFLNTNAETINRIAAKLYRKGI